MLASFLLANDCLEKVRVVDALFWFAESKDVEVFLGLESVFAFSEENLSESQFFSENIILQITVN